METFTNKEEDEAKVAETTPGDLASSGSGSGSNSSSDAESGFASTGSGSGSSSGCSHPGRLTPCSSSSSSGGGGGGGGCDEIFGSEE